MATLLSLRVIPSQADRSRRRGHLRSGWRQLYLVLVDLGAVVLLGL